MFSDLCSFFNKDRIDISFHGNQIQIYVAVMETVPYILSFGANSCLIFLIFLFFLLKSVIL